MSIHSILVILSFLVAGITMAPDSVVPERAQIWVILLCMIVNSICSYYMGKENE